MNSYTEIITSFFEAYANKNHKGMRKQCSIDLQYFDPLYNYLKQQEIFIMWESKLSDMIDFKLNWDNIKDAGDGYYTVDCHYEYRNKESNTIIHQTVKSHLRIEHELITEYSEAFSLHELLKQEKGFIGNLIGWKRYYQNRFKLKVRRKLFEKINSNS